MSDKECGGAALKSNRNSLFLSLSLSLSLSLWKVLRQICRTERYIRAWATFRILEIVPSRLFLIISFITLAEPSPRAILHSLEIFKQVITDCRNRIIVRRILPFLGKWFLLLTTLAIVVLISWLSSCKCLGCVKLYIRFLNQMPKQCSLSLSFSLAFFSY